MSDSFSKLIGGGSDSSQQSTSGFSLLPKSIQDAFTQYAGQLTNGTGNAAANTAAFTPLAQTAGETNAINSINNGFALTPQSLQSNMAMLKNPFDSSVINTINQQANGQNSLVNQAATQAGQQGSNRNFLGNSDIEQNRLNSIGTFEQGQYNTNLNSILNSIIPQQQQDANNQLTAGTYQRNLGLQTSEAPYTALSAINSLLSGLPQSGGSQSSGSSSSQNGLFSGGGGTSGGNAISGIGSILSLL